MAMLGIRYDRNLWKQTIVARIQEYGRRQWRTGFGKIRENNIMYT